MSYACTVLPNKDDKNLHHIIVNNKPDPLKISANEMQVWCNCRNIDTSTMPNSSKGALRQDQVKWFDDLISQPSSLFTLFSVDDMIEFANDHHPELFYSLKSITGSETQQRECFNSYVDQNKIMPPDNVFSVLISVLRQPMSPCARSILYAMP